MEAVLPDGRFGAAEETGREWNGALQPRGERGAGEALGGALERAGPARARAGQPAAASLAQRVPVTVHVAVGTDTPHTHPAANAAALGAATHRDFRLFCSLVAALNGGGVYINAGSAVVMPEVFLKARFRGAQSGPRGARLHHRESGFPAALPAARECSGAAPHAEPEDTGTR